MNSALILVVIGIFVVGIIVILATIAAFYKKIPQGQAMVRTGMGGTKVDFEGMWVVPTFHKAERMDLSLKKIEVNRMGKDGLICKDNLRADIKVVFFVRVNSTVDEVKKVAQTVGCERASSLETLNDLFDAKFSEALKTVGKKFDFVDLYESRQEFRDEILDVIGTDLNGYVLDDCAIDYLEQTPIDFLKDDNILDVQGIKKITELTAKEKIKANLIRREEEKTIKKQDVEAQEAQLEYDRQLAEKEESTKREIATIKARENAEIEKVTQEERLKAERAKITAQEEIDIAQQNKDRQVILAVKQKERVEAVETEKVEKDRQLEITEREKVVTLAQISKEKSIEEERRNIQDVIKERIIVERTVVEEEEKIKDTRAVAEAERSKKVAITNASEKAEAALIATTKSAEADRLAAEIEAEKKMIDAEANKNASIKEAEAKKIMAEAKAAEEAAMGVSEAQVIEAKANAEERKGTVEANIMEKRAIAEAASIEVRAEADKKRGLAEAEVTTAKADADAKMLRETALAKAEGVEKLQLAQAKGIEAQGLAQAKGIEAQGLAQAKSTEAQGLADAKGVEAKAEAMKKLDAVGKEHEEFKLRLEKEKAVELAKIEIQRAIAEAQASAMSEALKSSKIDIVGGETMFYENIMNAITRAKTFDSLVDNSSNLTQLKGALLSGEDGNGDPIAKIRNLIGQFGLNTSDVKNLTISALLLKMSGLTKDDGVKGTLSNLLNAAKSAGLEGIKVGTLGL